MSQNSAVLFVCDFLIITVKSPKPQKLSCCQTKNCQHCEPRKQPTDQKISKTLWGPILYIVQPQKGEKSEKDINCDHYGFWPFLNFIGLEFCIWKPQILKHCTIGFLWSCKLIYLVFLIECVLFLFFFLKCLFSKRKIEDLAI